MKHFSKIFIIKFYLVFSFFFNSYSLADNHNIYETLEKIQKDIQTLEKAVYSGSVNLNNNELNNSLISSLVISNDQKQMETLTELKLKTNENEPRYDVLHRALLTGLIGNIIKYYKKGEFLAASNTPVQIHHESVLSGKRPEWILSSGLIGTHKNYALVNASISKRLIFNVASKFLTYTYFDPHWSAKKGAFMMKEGIEVRRNDLNKVFNKSDRIHRTFNDVISWGGEE